MDLRFFLICFGILGCYAAIRTVRRGWVRAIIVMLVFVSVVQLGFDVLFPAPPAGTVTAANEKDYLTQKVENLEDDRCMMSHLRDSPLSSVAYILEMHRFLLEMKKLQTPEMASQNNLGTFARLYDESFGDDTVPSQTTIAVAGKNGSLCEKFTQWASVEEQAHGLVPQAALHTASPSSGAAEPSSAPSTGSDNAESD